MLRTFSQRSTFDGGAFCFAESLSIAIREEGGKSALRSAPGADTQSEPAKFALTDQQEEGSKVFSRIKLRFKSNPPLWYAMSDCGDLGGRGFVHCRFADCEHIRYFSLAALGIGQYADMHRVRASCSTNAEAAQRGKEQACSNSDGADVRIPDLGKHERYL